MPRGDKPTTTALALKDGWVHEDALPPTITKEQYDWWYKESLVLDGVRMGPPLPDPVCRFCDQTIYLAGDEWRHRFNESAWCKPKAATPRAPVSLAAREAAEEIETRVGLLPLSLIDEIQQRRNTIYKGMQYHEHAAGMKTDLDYALAFIEALRKSSPVPAAGGDEDGEPLVADMQRALVAAGWVAESAIKWRAPDGSLWRGPYGAWKELRRRAASTAESGRVLEIQDR